MEPEASLAAALRTAFRDGFARRDAAAAHLSELVLDAVDAVLPLERHAPAEGALEQLEALATSVDVYSYEGAPGWDVVLAEGLRDRDDSQRDAPGRVRATASAGPSVLDGLGAPRVREEQRGELKRRTRSLARRLVELGREAANGADAATVVALHATLLRLFGTAAISSALLLPEDPAAGALPDATNLAREIDERQGGFALAQEEWLARLVAQNPVATAAPAFRRYFAGLSQTLRTAEALRRVQDGGAPDFEALLGPVGGWQPVRWRELRSGAPAGWITLLCPAVPEVDPRQRLRRESRDALDTLGRLWNARELSPTGFATLYAAFVARCASVAALAEELL